MTNSLFRPQPSRTILRRLFSLLISTIFLLSFRKCYTDCFHSSTYRSSFTSRDVLQSWLTRQATTAQRHLISFWPPTFFPGIHATTAISMQLNHDIDVIVAEKSIEFNNVPIGAEESLEIPPPLNNIVDINIQRQTLIYEVELNREHGIDITQGTNNAVVGKVCMLCFSFIKYLF